MSDYKDLHVWQKSMDLTESVYQITRSFPKEEVYGITSQIRRSAVSVPSNIAEGSSRAGKKEFIKFLLIARGSAAELETQIMLAQRIGYLSDIKAMTDQIKSIRQMLNALIRRLNYGL